jgi:hypothetical protein
MKKPFIIFIILTLFSLHTFALNQSDFDGKVDFSITLKELNELIEKGYTHTAPTQKFIILSGTISNISILDETQSGYLVEIELTGGEWIGVEQVISYHVLIRFSGYDFQKYFNKERGAQAPEEKIEANSSVLIVAKVLTTTSTRSREKVWLLEGYYVRKLE